jgi:N-hydroxyarylamine O-acetyltransferase
LLSVPFENLDIHWHHPIVLDVGEFYKKIVENRRGGFCYELNGLFNELLAGVGYRTRLVSGRVFNAVGEPGPEFDHMAIVVVIDGQEYLTDVGFGEFSAAPLMIDPSAEQIDREGTFIIRFTEHGSFDVEKKVGDSWKRECRFGRNAHVLADFSEMCEFHQLSPKSHFTNGKICSLMTQNGRKTLTDRKLIVTAVSEKSQTAFDSDDRFAELLLHEFGIERDV